MLWGSSAMSSPAAAAAGVVPSGEGRPYKILNFVNIDIKMFNIYFIAI